VVYYELGRLSEALHDLDRAVELAPDQGELLQNRAVARRELGLISDAAADLQRYVELFPSAEDADEVRREIETLLVALSVPA
jgi:regulator of sirC expression with transglutaminase-like and TPR domain